MSSSSPAAIKLKPVIRIVLVGMLAAVTMAAQVMVSFLPNVELVSVLLLVYAVALPLGDTVLVVLVFSLLEGLVWGFGDWVIGYCWIWNFLVVLAKIAKPVCQNRQERWALFAAVWGFLFGALFAVQHGILYGASYGYAYWLKGLTFDIVHATANYITVLLLYPVLIKVFTRLYQRLESTYGNHNR